MGCRSVVQPLMYPMFSWCSASHSKSTKPKFPSEEDWQSRFCLHFLSICHFTNSCTQHRISFCKSHLSHNKVFHSVVFSADFSDWAGQERRGGKVLSLQAATGHLISTAKICKIELWREKAGKALFIIKALSFSFSKWSFKFCTPISVIVLV